MSSNEHDTYDSEKEDSANNNDLDDKALLEEYQKTTLKGAGKTKKKDWVPDEQYRLLYVYFKDMSLEPLLKSKQEVEVSAKIKKSEFEINVNPFISDFMIFDWSGLASAY